MVVMKGNRKMVSLRIPPELPHLKWINRLVQELGQRAGRKPLPAFALTPTLGAHRRATGEDGRTMVLEAWPSSPLWTLPPSPRGGYPPSFKVCESRPSYGEEAPAASAFDPLILLWVAPLSGA